MADWILNSEGIYEAILSTGRRLAETSEKDGGWAEYFEGEGLTIDDQLLRAQTAVMLENTKQWLGSQCGMARRDSRGRRVVNESTVSAMVGGFSDFLFPIVRAAFPTNPINDLVSVQPTTKPNATVIFWNWIYGTNKGSYTQGQRMFDANRGQIDAGMNYTNDVIDREVVGTGTGSSATITGTLKFHDGGGVRPGTVRLTATVSSSDVTAYDNGNGGFGGGLTGTIDYDTGQFSITYGGNVDNATSVLAAYRWNSEGSDMVPEVDVQIVTSTVATERRAVKINYSAEAVQDVSAELGEGLEPRLITGATEKLNSEIARQIIHEIWVNTTVSASFGISVPSGRSYSQQQHFGDFVYTLTQASNTITNATQKAYGNWIIVDDLAANMIEALPSTIWQAAPRPANVSGIHFIGTLQGRYKVYKDIFLGTEPNASSYGNLLMGYKGTDVFEAGFVWSPYRLFYSTDTITLANFLSQKGMGSRYGTKMVNPRMYTRINLTA